MDYLRLKEATTLPPPKMQNALLRAYLEYIHPMLPMINLEDFLESMSTVDDTTGRVSLAFFQAVMFAGSAFVDMRVLKKAGYPTRAEARNSLYRKVQLLYNFDYETDRLVLIQILLLMSLWHETLDRTRNAGHWIDIAVSHAYAIGLHTDPWRSKPPMSITGQRLRRRTWWCCFIRDRYICLGGERVPQIRDSDFNVPILEMADFQSEHLQGKIPSASYAICPYIADANKRGNLANLCIDQIKLCKGSVFINECHYTITSKEPLLHEQAPKRFPVSAETFADSYRKLLEWYDSSSQCNATQPYSLDSTTMNYDKHIFIYRVMLLMVYHGQILQLHRLRLEDPQTSPFEKPLSRMLVNHSAQRISRLAKTTQDLGIIEFLPGTTISIIKLALAMGHSETKDVLQAVASEENECHRQCARTLEILQEIHVATDCNKRFTDDLIFDNTDPDLYRDIELDFNTCVDDDAENEDPAHTCSPSG
ncbi:unnamed protein product [Clonostachys solani]|uniref:Xylanolytic transcriptional activator regulatory domain-containing protein n=1 Tax=Clonostachys solani TaxID=160281 RepID=A0A9N9ZHJ8_9HYPO|nr:unnamed protein product [Clonostachys solani]